MDMKKFGSTLKELRTSRKLTQEQLAERFGISPRTVSRWETGATMPDIDMLIELSDFYRVDIRTIISTGRKSEKMEEKEKETIQAVASYKDEEQKRFVKRLIVFVSLAIAAVLCGAILSLAGVNSNLKEYLYGGSAGFTLSVLVLVLLYILNVRPKRKLKRVWRIIIPIICAALFVSLGVCAALQDSHALNNVLKCEFTREVTVGENGTETDEFDVPFSIDESGSYSLSFDVKGENIGFITGVALMDENGNEPVSFTVGSGNSHTDGLKLDAGNYIFRFTVLDSQEKTDSFVREHGMTQFYGREPFVYQSGTFKKEYKIILWKNR